MPLIIVFYDNIDVISPQTSFKCEGNNVYFYVQNSDEGRNGGLEGLHHLLLSPAPIFFLLPIFPSTYSSSSPHLLMEFLAVGGLEPHPPHRHIRLWPQTIYVQKNLKVSKVNDI
jgi:hypothetical protein